MSGVSTTSMTTLKTDVTSKVLPGDKSGLPLEIWQIIFSFLSVQDLCRVARVSKTWHDLSLSIDMTRWKELYLRCQEWRHPFWPLSTQPEPLSWKLAYRNQHLSSRFWYHCSRQAHKAGCLTLLKRSRERQTLEVGPGLQHQTLKSAFAVAGEYDRILVHPGIYDEQLEMSLKVPFELMGVGELGSVILVVCAEHLALTGRLSNLVLRAPWFTNFILMVKSGYLQMDNCIVEEGMVCVMSPASVHVQFCTFRHSTVILQHVAAAIIRNCEFSQSDNANIVVEGDPSEERGWAYPHLCQQMDGVFSPELSEAEKGWLRFTTSTTSTLRSFAGKSFTASSLAKTWDDGLSRGRAFSQDCSGDPGLVNGNGMVPVGPGYHHHHHHRGGGGGGFSGGGGGGVAPYHQDGFPPPTTPPHPPPHPGRDDSWDSGGGVVVNHNNNNNNNGSVQAWSGGDVNPATPHNNHPPHPHGGTSSSSSAGRRDADSECQRDCDSAEAGGKCASVPPLSSAQTSCGGCGGCGCGGRDGLGGGATCCQTSSAGSCGRADCRCCVPVSAGVVSTAQESGGVETKLSAGGECVPKNPGDGQNEEAEDEEDQEDDGDGEWLEIADERKPWQLEGEERQEREAKTERSRPLRDLPPRQPSSQKTSSSRPVSDTTSSYSGAPAAPPHGGIPTEGASGGGGERVFEKRKVEGWERKEGEEGCGQQQGGLADSSVRCGGGQTQIPMVGAVGGEGGASHGQVSVVPALVHVHSSAGGGESVEGGGGNLPPTTTTTTELLPSSTPSTPSAQPCVVNGTESHPHPHPHPLPLNNSNRADQYRLHNPPLLHNPHPQPRPVSHPVPNNNNSNLPPSSPPHHPPCHSAQQPVVREDPLHPHPHPHPPAPAVAGAGARVCVVEGGARERPGSRGSYRSSSDDDDDLSILNDLESAGSRSVGSHGGPQSSSSSDDDSEVEDFFRADSGADCSDTEESVIMLPHLRQKHLEASLSANAVNADVGSLCSHASHPITLSATQDEGVLSHVHRVRGCLIHHCRMMHSKGGVMVTLQGHALISACDISNVSFGIRCIQNARVVVLKNRIHHCTTSGIFMRLAASGLIAGNDIHSNNEAGLDIRKNADPIVQHNRIHHGKRSGVVVLGSGRGQIRSNNIYSNTEAGIYILYGGNPTVSENHIYDGKAAGVAVNEGGQGFIFDNTISSNQWGGVDIRRGSCPVVSRNTITNGLGDGIVIGDQGQGTIENNVISDNAGCGLWLMSASRPYIHGNQISNNGDTGVMMVNKTDIQHEGSHLLPAGPESVDHISRSLSMMGSLDDLPAPPPKCVHTTLQHNNIHHNAGRGVAVELGGRVDVMYNAIYANHHDGVWVSQDCPVALRANSISANRGHGVLTALTAQMEVSGNGIYDNRDCGVTCSGNVDITENDIVGNQAGGITVEENGVAKITGNRVQTPSGSGVRVGGGGEGVVVEDNTLWQGAGQLALDVPLTTVVRDNHLVLPPPSGGARPRGHKDPFNKSTFLSRPPARPAVQPPPPPTTLPDHPPTSLTKGGGPSSHTGQQGSKLCRIL